MRCYSLAKHAKFCEPGIVTFSKKFSISLSKFQNFFNFFVEELVENNSGKTGRILVS